MIINIFDSYNDIVSTIISMMNVTVDIQIFQSCENSPAKAHLTREIEDFLKEVTGILNVDLRAAYDLRIFGSMV